MIEIGIKDTSGNIEPTIKLVNPKISITELTTVLFFLSTGIYTEKLYEKSLASLNEGQKVKLQKQLSTMLKMVGMSVDSVSDTAELESAKQSIISSDAVEETEQDD